MNKKLHDLNESPADLKQDAADVAAALEDNNLVKAVDIFLHRVLGRELDSYSAYDGYNMQYSVSEDDVVGGLTMKLVHAHGGGEGEGEHVERVFQVNHPSFERPRYVEITGFYDSYNGTEWDNNMYEVYPRQVMVTQYHPTSA
jgi:hypothetical protein